MIKASKEKLNNLYTLEKEYFELKGFNPCETDKCILRGKIAKGSIKCEEYIDEGIENLKILIEELKKELQIKNEKEIKEKEEIIRSSEEKGFAILKGSEKQIKWANDLRDKFINDINKIKEESKKDKDLKFLNIYFSDAGIKNINITFDLIEKTLDNILKQKNEATFYIDNRFKKAIDVIIEEMQRNNK